MITVCCPSRGRPDFAARLYKSIVDTARGKVELLLAVDSDDPTLLEYQNKCPDARILIGERHVLGTLYNRMWKEAHGDILMLTGDDMYFVTKDWDIEVEKTMHLYPDKICFVTGNTGVGSGLFLGPIYVFVTKRVCEILGYFCPPWLSRWIDIWVADVGSKVGRLVKVNMSIDHIHPSTGRRERDQTIEELDRTVHWDTQVYWGMDYIRTYDANTLRKYLKKSHVILM